MRRFQIENHMDGKLLGFYRGVVEDIDDPLQAGRVRARIFGLHTSVTTKKQYEGIPTTELPWIEPCLPIVDGAINGYGIFSIPQVDSQIMIFFEGGSMLAPRYFASMPGKDDYNTQAKNSYPDNTVLAVHGGHYIELDSTSGSARMKLYHKSGTYIEITDEGNLAVTAVGDKTVDITGDDTETITGNVSITISGTADVTCSGDMTVTAPNVTVTGNLSIAGSITGTAGSGDVELSGSTINLNP